MPSVSESLGTSRVSSCAISFPPKSPSSWWGTFREKKGSVIFHKWGVCSSEATQIPRSFHKVSHHLHVNYERLILQLAVKMFDSLLQQVWGIFRQLLTRQMLGFNIMYGWQEPWSGNVILKIGLFALQKEKLLSVAALWEHVRTKLFACRFYFRSVFFSKVNW